MGGAENSKVNIQNRIDNIVSAVGGILRDQSLSPSMAARLAGRSAAWLTRKADRKS